MQELDWADLRYVLALSRSYALSAAAQRLGVNETTVARRLRRLEAVLEAQLFERTEGRLTATEAGRQAVFAAERMELEAQALTEAVSGVDTAVAGTVRVTMVPVLAHKVVAPALPELLSRFPDLRVELVADARDFSLTKREADIALRLARPSRETRSIARKVGSLDYAVFAGVSAAEPLSWIHYDDGFADLPQHKWMRGQDGDVAPVSVNDAEGLIACVKAGLGKALLPLSVGSAEPGLQRMGNEIPVLSRELWLITHPDLRGLARIKAVGDWLAGLASTL